MSIVSSGNTPQNLQQQRKLAKDLLKAARAGDAEAISRVRRVHPSKGQLKLADAQLVIAREGGFESWPKLVKKLEERELRAFKDAIQSGNAKTLRRLLSSSARLRKKINDPMFEFGRRPINAAAKHVDVVDVLVEFGADINARSDWKNGPYGILDECPEDVARELIERGAKLTACAAARLGWLDELRQIVAENPQAVHETGGDGQRPLHYAKTPQVASFLLDHDADIDARCIDHNSTAAQYALKDRLELTKFLLDRGATPDIFMPARLGDLALAKRLLDANPDCLAARTAIDGYKPVPAFGIYNWVLGFYLSPHEVALQFDHRDVFELLWQHSPPKVRLLVAAMRADQSSAREALREDPKLMSKLSQADHSLLASAAMNDRRAAFMLMLDLGFDPMAPGQDSGTPLHTAAWIGSLAMIDALLKRNVDINAVEPTHGSTPLGWALHGSVHRRRKGADYAAVVERLIRAGANVKSPGNKYGQTMIEMAEGNPQVQEALRCLGAT